MNSHMYIYIYIKLRLHFKHFKKSHFGVRQSDSTPPDDQLEQNPRVLFTILIRIKSDNTTMQYGDPTTAAYLDYSASFA